MIVTTIEQIRAILPNVAAEVEFTDFEPHVKSAEHWISKDILGASLYASIDAGEISDDALSRHVQTCIVLKAYEMGIPYMDLVQTQSGFGVIQDKNRAPASQQRVERLIASNSVKLNNETDWLIEYLEDNSTYHDSWKSSPAFSLLSDCLIITARQLKRFIKFTGTREEFLQMKPSLLQNTIIKLHPAISRSYAEELVTKQNAGTLNAYDEKILPGLKQALANFATDNFLMGDRLLGDVVTIMDADLENYPTYSDSDEKALKDDPGYQNLEDDATFVFMGGM